MKILLINYEFPPLGGGAANAAFNIAQSLAKSGHKIVVITSHFHDLPMVDTQSGCYVVRIPVGRRKINKGSLIEMILFMIKGMIKVKSLAKELKPDVILVFFSLPCGPIGYVASRIAKCPYIISLRGMDIPGFMKGYIAFLLTLLSPVTWLLWRQAAALVVTNKFMKKLVRESTMSYGLSINIIPNGINCNQFNLPEVSPSDKPFRFLFVGRLVKWQKGLEDLLIAFIRLRKILSQEIILDIVGDGVLREALEQFVKENGITSDVNFYGWIAKENLVTYYHRSHVFVLPTRRDGMANSLLEAMACGLPVITTKPAAADLIENGKHGLVIVPGDVDALMEAMTILIEQKKERLRMGKQARKRVQTLSWDKVAESYERLLQLSIEKY